MNKYNLQKIFFGNIQKGVLLWAPPNLYTLNYLEIICLTKINIPTSTMKIADLYTHNNKKYSFLFLKNLEKFI